MKLLDVKAELNELGMSIRKVDGEYRVYPKGTSADHGYFTDDLTDALMTGRYMATEKNWSKLTPETMLTDALHLIKLHIGDCISGNHDRDLHEAVQLIVDAGRTSGIMKVGR